MKLELDRSRKEFIIGLDYGEPGFREKKDIIMSCPNGRRWNPEKKKWFVQATLMNMDVLFDIPDIKGEILQYCQELVPGFFRKPDPGKRIHFTSTTQPLDHQAWLTSYLINLPVGYLVFGGLGTGKTAVMAYLIRNRFMDKRILIVAPNKVLPVWPRELRKHAGINGVIMKESKWTRKKRHREIERSWIYVVNYESVYPDRNELLAKGFQVIIFDESHYLRNDGTNLIKAVIPVTDSAEYVYGLTGTPRANTDRDVFNQVRVANPYVFGVQPKSFEAFWLEKIGGFQMEKTGKNGKKYIIDTGKWRTKPALSERFHNVLRSTSVYIPENVLKLPPLTYLQRYVEMPGETREIYSEIKDELILRAQEERISLKSALTKYTKLGQICGGCVYGPDGNVVYSNDFKCKLLVDIMTDEIEPDGRCLVWFEFKHNLELASKTLRKAGIRHTIIHGNTKENVAALIDRFKTDTGIKAILTTSVLKEGQTILEARYHVVFGHGYSFLNRKQSLHRNYRFGQDQPVIVIDLVTQGTIEEKIMEALQDKGDGLKRLLANLTVDDI